MKTEEVLFEFIFIKLDERQSIRGTFFSMDKRAVSEILDTVDSLKGEMIDTLQKLVRIPSIVGNEGPAQNFMVDVYDDLGLDVSSFVSEKDKLVKHPAFVDSEIPFQGRPNVIGVLHGEETKKSIILNGHIDVVSPEPVDQWQHDPWGAEIEGNRMYGRGSVDMKAGLVANAYALKALLKAGHRPLGEVMLQSVIEEEAGGGGGTLSCLIEGHTADGMIVPEPHPILCVSHVGVLYFRVRVIGLTAHAGRAHTGINAIGKMLIIYQALVGLDTERQVNVRFPLYQTEGNPACHINVGKMNSGDWPSTVPGFADIECRISFIPGETIGEIKTLIENTVAEAATKDPWLVKHPPKVEWYGWKAEPWFQDPEDPFVQMVLGNIKGVTGNKIVPIGNTAGLDTRFTSYFNFPAVCYGPAGGALHGFDEFVDLDSLTVCTKVIALSVQEWCGMPK